MKKYNYEVFDIALIPLKHAPLQAMLLLIQKILYGIVPTIQVIVTAKFLDKALSIVTKKGQMNEIAIPLSLLVGLIIYSWASDQLVKFIDIKLELKLREKFRASITEKRAKLRYSYIENNDTWDLMSRVAKDPEIKSKKAYNEFLALISMFIRIIGLLFVLITHVWWAAIIIICFSVPLFKIALRNGEESYEADREISKYKRKFEYLGEILTGRESGEERTLFGYTNKINDKWKWAFETARKIEYNVDLKNYIRTRLRSIITSIISITIVIILLKPVQLGLLSIGLYISISNGVFELIQMMSWQFTFYVSKLTENI